MQSFREFRMVEVDMVLRLRFRVGGFRVLGCLGSIRIRCRGLGLA